MSAKALGLFAAALLVGIDVPKDEVKKNDIELIKGTWKVTKALRDGQELPKDEAEKLTLVFDGKKVTVKEPNRDEGAEYTVDATKSPIEIDIKPGNGAERVVKGIIHVEGDAMKIAFLKDGGNRPTSFDPEKTKNLSLLYLQRAPK